jgi:hypothetical protein
VCTECTDIPFFVLIWIKIKPAQHNSEEISSFAFRNLSHAVLEFRNIVQDWNAWIWVAKPVLRLKYVMELITGWFSIQLNKSVVTYSKSLLSYLQVTKPWVSSKQSNFFSVRTETNRNSICFGCILVCFAKPQNFFRFVSVFQTGIETTETNRKPLNNALYYGILETINFFSVRTETNQNSICFGCFSVFFCETKKNF